MKSKVIALAVCCWALILLFFIVYFANTQGKYFDQQGELAYAASSMNYEADFIAALLKQKISLNNTVIHFYQDDCFCKLIATPHINAIKKLAQANTMVNNSINVNDLPRAAEFVPATPAVAVFDEQAQLRYFGPYASGMYCAGKKGLVEDFIPASDRSLGAAILTDASGCYCQL